MYMNVAFCLPHRASVLRLGVQRMICYKRSIRAFKTTRLDHHRNSHSWNCYVSRSIWFCLSLRLTPLTHLYLVSVSTTLGIGMQGADREVEGSKGGRFGNASTIACGIGVCRNYSTIATKCRGNHCQTYQRIRRCWTKFRRTIRTVA